MKATLLQVLVMDYKKYNILENKLQKINEKFIALPDEEKKRNNKLLQAIDKIIQSMRSKNVLFSNLYRNKFYGGSYYDGLKVGRPCEYDLDCVLYLPKIIEPSIEVSEKPGYVKVKVKNIEALNKNVEIAKKYPDLAKFVENGYLSTSKVNSWMESLMESVLTQNSTMEVDIDDTKVEVLFKKRKSGPAHTIKLEGVYNDTPFNIDIDLVTCFTFSQIHWPQGKYRKNCTKKDTFFVVPKGPKDLEALYWRLSFPEQEKELISRHSFLKPALKFIKKVRDRYDHTAIASYFIKTIFLWELDEGDKSIFDKSLSFAFVTMLEKYRKCLESGQIPYYWNRKNNLIEDISPETRSSFANKIKNIVTDIEKICSTKTNINNIVSYFLKNNEYDLEEDFLNEPSANSVSLPRSEDSCDGAKIPNTDLYPMLLNIETLCCNLASEQRRIFQILETVLDKIENCESQIKVLTLESEATEKGTESQRSY